MVSKDGGGRAEVVVHGGKCERMLGRRQGASIVCVGRVTVGLFAVCVNVVAVWVRRSGGVPAAVERQWTGLDRCKSSEVRRCAVKRWGS